MASKIRDSSFVSEADKLTVRKCGFMKKILLILGIVLIVIAVVALLAAYLWYFGAYHTMDGTADLYHRQIQMMWICLAVGVATMIAGVLCLVLRNRY